MKPLNLFYCSVPACTLALAGLAGSVSAQTDATHVRAPVVPRPAMPDFKSTWTEPAKQAVEQPAPAAASTAQTADTSVRGSSAGTPVRRIESVMHDVAADGALWARGEGWKARFASDGTTVVPRLGADAPRNFPVEMHLSSVTVAGAPLAFDASAAPTRAADRIVYDRGTLREVYDLEMAGLEQSFVLDELPSRGEIVVRVDLQSELARAAFADRIVLSNERGGLTFTRAIAVDADGARNELETTLEDGAMVIRVPVDVVEHARLPLVVDPFVFNQAVTNTTLDAILPDVAFDAMTGLTGFVWEEAFSSTDHDVWFQLRLPNGNLAINTPIDISGFDWRNPKVAANNFAHNFLVVADARLSTTDRQIVSRLVSGAGTSGAMQVVSNGVTHDSVLPDVGGDYYTGPSTNFGVVWQRNFNAADTDILFANVDPVTGAAGTVVYLQNSAGTLDKHPSISKGTGAQANSFQGWNIVWDHQATPSDRDIYGAQITYAGTIVTQPSAVNLSTADDAYPTASTCLAPISQNDYWFAAWQRNAGNGSHDIYGSAMLGGTAVTTANLSQLDGFDVSKDQIAAQADCDGSQFFMVYMETFATSTTDFDIYFSQYALVGNQLIPTSVHQNLAYTSAVESWPQIANDYSSGGSGACFGATWSNDVSTATVSIRGVRYCGQAGGTVETFCSGFASLPTCPCGPGGQGRGCPNSVNGLGALLSASGSADVSNDTLVLHAEGMPATSSCLYFQGANVTPPVVFGDGLRCLAGTIVRLGPKTNVNGESQYPGPGNQSVSQRGGVPPAGGYRGYQVWYRNSGAFCTPSTFNLTNGLRVLWVP